MLVDLLEADHICAALPDDVRHAPQVEDVVGALGMMDVERHDVQDTVAGQPVGGDVVSSGGTGGCGGEPDGGGEDGQGPAEHGRPPGASSLTRGIMNPSVDVPSTAA